MSKVIAFVPARGGSKSIPLKNIKDFCGKPLIYWSLSALENCTLVDKIIVATDSDEIADKVISLNFNKVVIYRRLAVNAADTSTTESVILEYLNKGQESSNDIFLTVQATSPLTQSQDFTDALSIYKKSDYQSMLSVVRHKRFFWNTNGTSKNYDYTNRPRRQDFDGEIMENGAFYINTVKGVLESKNRLSGKIGFYEMPDFNGFEIDEPDDWGILEQLMNRYIIPKAEKNIKLFASDVDGVLTDAGMYYSENGDELKKFNTRDGKGFELLRNAGIKTAIITSEETQIVSRRATKLKVDYLYQGQSNGGKLTAIKEICKQEKIRLEEVAYIGDDVNCIEALQAVGVAACPADAVDTVKAIPNITVLSKKGGEGVVREFIEKLI